jgi:O-antigen/teichoic acid export membrane protein
VAQGVLSQLFTTVSLPAFSEIARNEPSRLREVYYKLRVPGDLALLFMMGFLITAGQFLIDLLYDHRYADAGGMLRIMAITLFSFRYGVAMQTYLAVGLPRYQAIINIVRFVSLYLFVPAMYYMFGAEGAIWGVALNEMITIPFVYYFSGKLRLNDFKREFGVLLALPVGLLCGYLFQLLQLLQLFHR